MGKQIASRTESIFWVHLSAKLTALGWQSFTLPACLLKVGGFLGVGGGLGLVSFFFLWVQQSFSIQWLSVLREMLGDQIDHSE